MLGQIKNVKSEEQFLSSAFCTQLNAYNAAHSRALGRTESLSVLVLLPTMEENELLMCVTFACM